MPTTGACGRKRDDRRRWTPSSVTIPRCGRRWRGRRWWRRRARPCWSRARAGPERSWSRGRCTSWDRTRADPFVAVNCGALPRELAESELFGHERGAFTGAAVRRIGWFEEASGGTLVLDEIGELPLDLQPKLLRVLETGRLRRVGGAGEVAVRVRVVAMTLRDLQGDVSRRSFRGDLYYRLAGFCLRLPPLRERRGDIPLLAAHFLREIAGEVGDRRLDAAALSALTTATFPGQRARAAEHHPARGDPERPAGRRPHRRRGARAVAPALASGSPRTRTIPHRSRPRPRTPRCRTMRSRSPAARSTRSSARSSGGPCGETTAAAGAPRAPSASRGPRSATR